MHQLTTVQTVYEAGSWLFTVRDQYGELEEVVLVPCEDTVEHDSTSSRPGSDDGVEAWINRCTHESQRFDTGDGAPIRNGQLICPRHGSLFDSCSGDCDNGEAAGTTLPSVNISVTHDTIYLTDDDVTFAHEGGIDEDEGPDSTSHISF
ncbi:Rieske (2Fe-2S) protein [Salinadaptatus halalkaliphilus]|uniref:Rieske (2Fe-2S) protein n=1 Tax=Salinadaptatus halalkaliphilus TaxID=2419781 RepID=A0A4S3TLH2_9EURY|nr:Rieske 2Fe-2S domain-containing protein [Salinadaptatus halalkaliphilus]THE63825.1 Rieske (2Fe-2S) protein [Salinadaptatus halalkaliphilus]